MDLKTFYLNRNQHHNSEARQLTTKYNRLAILRLLIFLIGVALSFVVIKFGAIAMTIYVVVFLLGFGKFISWHKQFADLKRLNIDLADVNQDEIDQIDRKVDNFETGEYYKDHLHPYSVDLDLFGQYSFFQYLNRCSTLPGKDQLAAYLKETPQSLDEILARQASIKELSTKTDWRQKLQAIGRNTEDDRSHVELLELWLNEPPFVLNNKWIKTALWILPPYTMTLPVLWLMDIVPGVIAILLAFPTLYLIKVTLERVGKTHLKTSKAGKIVKNYANIIQHIETESFSAPKLQLLKNKLTSGQAPASKNIRRLAYIIEQLDARLNPFAIILNIFGLWDLQWILRLERWREAQKEELPLWFEAMKEFEVLQSFGTLAFNHPDWSFPEIWLDSEQAEQEIAKAKHGPYNTDVSAINTLKEDSPYLLALELGHPLINASERVNNDFSIPSKSHIKLITGSNMGGKSTFLRTVGLNIVLANMGSSVCAKKFHCPILNVWTSMRTQDALHESTSSFYAELKRLKRIIEAVEANKHCFFLLDEILKGTNSKDQHKGAKALVRQLLAQEGVGLIATHDLKIGEMVNEYPHQLENVCFEVDVEDDQLSFDYKIKKGISKSFNATQLMRKIGIQI